MRADLRTARQALEAVEVALGDLEESEEEVQEPALEPTPVTDPLTEPVLDGTQPTA